jgi:hypothetical protein
MGRKREMRIDDVRSLLERRCREAGGQRAFAREHGLTVQHVNRVLHEGQAPVGRICDALGIEYDGGRWTAKRKS